MIDFEKKLQQAIELYEIAGVHPAANIPPFMSEREYAELVEDVKENGFLHPVRITKDELLIDGRNRLCASIDVGKDVRIEEYTPINPIKYVLSENKRRNLTYEQRLAMAVKAESLYAEDAKKRQLSTLKKGTEMPDVSNLTPREDSLDATKTRTKAAEQAGVSTGALGTYKKLKNKAPELADKVDSGELSLNAANNEYKETQYVKPTKKFNPTNENIEWAKWSWNPVTGCKNDCQYCYARDIAMRFDGDFDSKFHEDRLNAPADTKVPKGREAEAGIANVFVCSMADLFGDWVEKDWIERVLSVCKEQNGWNYLFLTKNPKRYLEFEFTENCWLGASATNQTQFNNATKVFKQMSNNNIKFLSCEPLNERIDANELNVDWLIVGGRSKSSRMPAFQPEWEWVERLLFQARKKRVQVYFKPNLTVRPIEYPQK